MSASHPLATKTKPEVLIVGAGPAGLVLALCLLRNGVPVRIIEKDLISKIGQRGAAITPRTLEIFENLSIEQEVVRRAIPLARIAIYKMPEATEVIKEFDMAAEVPASPDLPYTNFRALGQDKLDKILRTEIAKWGGSVEFGVEFQSLEEIENGVRVRLLKSVSNEIQEEEMVYKYVIGADGGKSAVRKQLGLPFLGQTTEENFVVGDVRVEGLRLDRWHIFGEMGDIMIFFRPIEDEGVMTIFLGGSKLKNHAEIIASEENLKATVKKLTGYREDIHIREIIWLGHYRTNIRMTETFAKGRIFITGDAAHIHSPTGGQGMNTGIQDSFNLGWKLSLVLKGHASAPLLATFTEERLPVVAEMLDLTTIILNKTVGEVGSTAGWNRGDSLKQLGVNYRLSSIVLEEDKKREGDGMSSNHSWYYHEPGGFVQAGDRAPDAPGLFNLGDSESNPMRLFKLLSPSHHTIIIFLDRISDAKKDLELSFLKNYPTELIRTIVIISPGHGSNALSSRGAFDAYEDSDGHAYRAYNGPEALARFFAIRPDGVVGARVGSPGRLKAYFDNIFHSASMSVPASE